MSFKGSSKPVVFHRRWMVVKVSPNAGTEIMPAYSPMTTIYYNRSYAFILGHHIETRRNIFRQLGNGE